MFKVGMTITPNGRRDYHDIARGEEYKITAISKCHVTSGCKKCPTKGHVEIEGHGLICIMGTNGVAWDIVNEIPKDINIHEVI